MISHPFPPRRTPDNLRWRSETAPERTLRLAQLRKLDDLLQQVEDRNERGFAHTEALTFHQIAFRRLGGCIQAGCSSAQLAARIIDYQDRYMREQVEGPLSQSMVLMSSDAGLL